MTLRNTSMNASPMGLRVGKEAATSRSSEMRPMSTPAHENEVHTFSREPALSSRLGACFRAKTEPPSGVMGLIPVDSAITNGAHTESGKKVKVQPISISIGSRAS